MTARKSKQTKPNSLRKIPISFRNKPPSSLVTNFEYSKTNENNPSNSFRTNSYKKPTLENKSLYTQNSKDKFTEKLHSMLDSFRDKTRTERKSSEKKVYFHNKKLELESLFDKRPEHHRLINMKYQFTQAPPKTNNLYTFKNSSIKDSIQNLKSTIEKKSKPITTIKKQNYNFINSVSFSLLNNNKIKKYSYANPSIKQLYNSYISKGSLLNGGVKNAKNIKKNDSISLTSNSYYTTNINDISNNYSVSNGFSKTQSSFYRSYSTNKTTRDVYNAQKTENNGKPRNKSLYMMKRAIFNF